MEHHLLHPKLQVEGYSYTSCGIEHRPRLSQAAVLHTSSFQGNDRRQGEGSPDAALQRSSSTSCDSIVYAEHYDGSDLGHDSTGLVITACCHIIDSRPWSHRKLSTNGDDQQEHEQISSSALGSDAHDSLTEAIIKKVRCCYLT
jgi:hypothetical protein